MFGVVGDGKGARVEWINGFIHTLDCSETGFLVEGASLSKISSMPFTKGIFSCG